jgi:DNA-binding CsgD family transcriptional regulator
MPSAISQPTPEDVPGIAPAEAARRLREVSAALARLAKLDSLGRLVAAAPREACAAAGFDRAMLSNLRAGQLRFASLSDEHFDPDVAADFGRLARAARPRLADCPPEHEAAAKQEPVIVRDAQHARSVFRPLVHFARTPAYVVAPITQRGMTIALLHADRVVDPRPLDRFDAELLQIFATGLGWLMRNLVLARRPVVEDLGGAWIDEAIDELTSATAPAALPPVAGLALAPPDPRLGGTGRGAPLTSREREVIALMAGGASNAGIAETLVISEATVKSHVRHILRKLEASNRTEAVSRFHAVGGAPGLPRP